MAVMKTAVTLLQELAVRRGEAPEFECVAQSGPAHSAVFEYRCQALGVRVAAAARSKKDAKQEAARRALLALAAAGELLPDVAAAVAALPAARPVPVPLAATDPAPAGPALPPAAPAPPDPATKPYVALLRELCEQYQLGAPEYAVVGDVGPPHARQFTLEARLGRHGRRATHGTKKAARQAAAEALYRYLRENLAHLTQDFVESEALARAHERAMERYVEVREEGGGGGAGVAAGGGPPLAQRVADYHRALPVALSALEASRREQARLALERAEKVGEGEEEVMAALSAALEPLGLRVEAAALAGARGPLSALRVQGAWPPPTALAASAAAAAAQLRALLLRALRQADAASPSPLAPHQADAAPASLLAPHLAAAGV